MPDIIIVCLGDSITWGFPFGPSYSWTDMLARSLAGAIIINEGVNGNTTGDMLSRFDRAVLIHNPTHVVIMGGANDILCADSYDRIVYNLRTILDKAGQAGIKVIIGLPTALEYPYWDKLLTRVRDWLREYAIDNLLPVIDFNQAFYDKEGRLLRELLLADGVHPTMEGYQAMFKQIDLNIFK